jgi:hypothetical protein
MRNISKPSSFETRRLRDASQDEVAAHQIFATIARFSFAMRASSRL